MTPLLKPSLDGMIVVSGLQREVDDHVVCLAGVDELLQRRRALHAFEQQPDSSSRRGGLMAYGVNKGQDSSSQEGIFVMPFELTFTAPGCTQYRRRKALGAIAHEAGGRYRIGG